MYVQYSPLCNSDPELYNKYLEVSRAVGNGSRYVNRRAVRGGRCGVVGDSGSGRLLLGGVGFSGELVDKEKGQGGECSIGGGTTGVVSSDVGDVTSGKSESGDGVDGVCCVSSDASGAGKKEGESVGLRRPGKKQRDRMIRKAVRQGSDVPEWRRKDGVVREKSEARKTLEEKWVKENRVAILKLEEQEKRLEARACVGFPTFKVKSPEALVLEEEERLKKLRQNIAKYDADIVYWNKRKQVGAVDKAIALEMEVLDGQLSGKYDVFADKRTIGWAKTVRTNSSTGSSAKKTVWSGSGASGLSNSSESVVSLEKYEALEKKHSEIVGRLSNRDVDMDRAKAMIKKLNKENKELRGESLYSAYD